MKREIPLFIIDTKKSHKKGECDFMVCTDKENGFVAKVEYIQQTHPELGDDYRIDYCRGGLSLKMSIRRMIGTNPDKAHVRTLLKKGMDYYVEAVTLSVDASKPSTLECLDFLEKLIDGNKHYLQQAGSDFDELQTIKTSMMMLDATRLKLQRLLELDSETDPTKN